MSTIAQVLRQVKGLKGEMAKLSKRAAESVSFQVGNEPPFDFAETRKELEGVRNKLVLLEATLAYANATTVINYEGKQLTLAAAIRWLQEYKAEIAWLQNLNTKCGSFESREQVWDDDARRSSSQKVITVFVSRLSEVERAKQIDELNKRFAQLNDLVETANHSTVALCEPPTES